MPCDRYTHIHTGHRTHASWTEFFRAVLPSAGPQFNCASSVDDIHLCVFISGACVSLSVRPILYLWGFRARSDPHIVPFRRDRSIHQSYTRLDLCRDRSQVYESCVKVQTQQKREVKFNQNQFERERVPYIKNKISNVYLTVRSSAKIFTYLDIAERRSLHTSSLCGNVYDCVDDEMLITSRRQPHILDYRKQHIANSIYIYGANDFMIEEDSSVFKD